MERKQLCLTQRKRNRKLQKKSWRLYTPLWRREGYNGIDQMVGYILSGDPHTLQSHNNARMMISRIDRDDLVEEILKDYLKK